MNKKNVQLQEEDKLNKKKRQPKIIEVRKIDISQTLPDDKSIQPLKKVKVKKNNLLYIFFISIFLGLIFYLFYVGIKELFTKQPEKKDENIMEKNILARLFEEEKKYQPIIKYEKDEIDSSTEITDKIIQELKMEIKKQKNEISTKEENEVSKEEKNKDKNSVIKRERSIKEIRNLIKDGEEEEAIKSLELLYNKNNSKEILRLLAELNFRKERYNEAVKYYEELLKITEDKELYFIIGFCYHKFLNNKNAAKNYYKIYIEKEGDKIEEAKKLLMLIE